MKGTSLGFISFKYYWIICIIVFNHVDSKQSETEKTGSENFKTITNENLRQKIIKCHSKTILVSILKTRICFHFKY